MTAHAAGRTDAGVHAVAMAAHIDLPRAFAQDEVMGALNAHLRPDPVGVIAATTVTTDLHARFSCYRRHYLYRLLPRRAPAPPEPMPLPPETKDKKVKMVTLDESIRIQREQAER